MPKYRGNNVKPGALFKAIGKTNNDELIEMAAEQLARLFWEQIKYNHRKKSK